MDIIEHCIINSHLCYGSLCMCVPGTGTSNNQTHVVRGCRLLVVVTAVPVLPLWPLFLYLPFMTERGIPFIQTSPKYCIFTVLLNNYRVPHSLKSPGTRLPLPHWAITPPDITDDH